jgi:hypothetical protein
MNGGRYFAIVPMSQAVSAEILLDVSEALPLTAKDFYWIG